MNRRPKAGPKRAKSRRAKAATLRGRNRAEPTLPRSSSAASQESEAARLASELSAMREVLRLISNSGGNVGTVLQSVAEQAAHICQAQFVDIFLVENDSVRDVAWFGELKRTLVFPLDRFTVAGRSICEMRPVSVDDLQNAADEFARGREIARKDGHRSILAVPLIRDSRAVGSIVIRRTEIRPFEQRHIALLTTFADQAVIAIENARLLNELRQRTDDLGESLEQQTATADVLGVISRQPDELSPLFDMILDNALRLCDASVGDMFRIEDGLVRVVGMRGALPEYAEFRRNQRPYVPPSDTPLGKAIQSREPVQIRDMRDLPGYVARLPSITAAVELGGARTQLLVPMIRDEDVIGLIMIFRVRCGPSSRSTSILLRILPLRPSSRSKTRGCSTSCASAPTT